MKYLLFIFLLLIPSIGWSQSHLITYQDEAGREVPIFADSSEEAIEAVTALIEQGFTKIQLGPWEEYSTLLETYYSIGPPLDGEVIYYVIWTIEGVDWIGGSSNIVDAERLLTDHIEHNSRAGNWELSELIKTTRKRIITRADP